MAKRRLFNIDIIDDDVFLSMPISAQALYFHLGMRADDDGFITPLKVMRAVGANQDDLRILIAKRYVLAFDSGVVVIKAWPVSNAVRPDRKISTKYQKELKELTFNEWGAYTEKRSAQTSLLEGVNSITTSDRGQDNQKPTNDNQMPAQVKLSKVKLSKVKLSKVNINTHGDKSPKSEIGSLYYQVIKKYDLPVTNHNVIQAKIKQMEKESDKQATINYLRFLLEQYQDLKLKYKPQIGTALDIYSKRIMIKNSIEQAINTKPKVRVA